MIRIPKLHCYSKSNRFYLSGTVWLMNVHMNMSQKTKLGNCHDQTESQLDYMNSLTDFTIKWQYPQPIGHHMRGKTIQISSFQVKIMP